MSKKCLPGFHNWKYFDTKIKLRVCQKCLKHEINKSGWKDYDTRNFKDSYCKCDSNNYYGLNRCLDCGGKKSS